MSCYPAAEKLWKEDCERKKDCKERLLKKDWERNIVKEKLWKKGCEKKIVKEILWKEDCEKKIGNDRLW